MGSVTQDNYSGFKRLYTKAIREGRRSFMFEGQEVLCDYAKYLVEYVDKSVLPKIKKI